MGARLPHPNTPLPPGNRWGDRLWWLMEIHGTTTRELAREVGRSTSCLQTFVANQHEPTAGVVVKVCQYYGVSADFLLGLSDKPRGE